MAKMQIVFLLITGPDVQPAEVQFHPGLNIINGPSNTGKSHILRLIDFALGSKDAPESLPEQVGYDLVHLGVSLRDGVKKTIVRPLQGGEIVVLDGLQTAQPTAKEGTVLSAQHNARKSLSKFLLEDVGAQARKIRTDAKGKTRELSFRDLLRLSIVDETDIQKKASPVLTGQFVTKTPELSVFKYVLMGVDDSALDIAQRDENKELRQAAQLELIDRQIRELDKEIEESSVDLEELRKNDEQIDAQLEKNFDVQERSEVTYRALLARRRQLRSSYDDETSRSREIQTLLRRFELLKKHYESDKRRLTSIQEAGQYYTLEEETVCPVCGAGPESHDPSRACDGDVERIAKAATAELLSLAERSRELELTINYLGSQFSECEERAKELLAEVDSVGEEITGEVPNVRTIRSAVQELLSKKLVTQRGLDTVRRRERMLEQRNQLGVGQETDSTTLVANNQLDGTLLDELCQLIERELDGWQFPSAARVFFETNKLDISLGGKSRTANGKGVRALLHGAFSIALLKFALQHKRAHPGFLILDSIFVTYRDPDGNEDQEIKSSALKDTALETLSSLSSELQVIIIENVSVPASIEKKEFYQHFTGTHGVGRFGLFPKLVNSNQGLV
jgi:hypothetical protein